jgi:methylenetetrahydrofolate dehydrogenase (NADP+)/methenyltetrahydrofolate cyclohydrolase
MRDAPAHRPCTPKGCMLLIDAALKELRRDRNLAGLHATVVGRSILVGRPMGILLLNQSCTVSICHSRTRNLVEECRRADILIAACGDDRLRTYQTRCRCH